MSQGLLQSFLLIEAAAERLIKDKNAIIIRVDQAAAVVTADREATYSSVITTTTNVRTVIEFASATKPITAVK